MKILFSFTYDTEAKQGVMAGNVEPTLALSIFQGLVIASLAKKGKGKPGRVKKNEHL